MQNLTRRTLNLIYGTSRRTFTDKDTKKLFDNLSGKEPEVPYESDIVLVGGGLVGMMCAYWIKQLNPVAYNVAVVEKDLTLRGSATSVFFEGLRQQHPAKEFIHMASFSAHFLRNIREHLAIPDLQLPDIHFSPQGCLMLSCDESSEQLRKRADLQSSLGVRVEVLGSEELGDLFPWINSSDVTLSTLGYENEGWFDVGLLMGALKGKTASMGVKFINGEVVSFGKESQKVYSGITNQLEEKFLVKELAIKVSSTGETYPLRFSRCLITAGSSSADVAKMAGIGVDDVTHTALPIQPRLKDAYLLECLDGPGLDMPMLHISSSIFVRRHHQLGHYICTALRPLNDLAEDDKSSDRFFDNNVKPQLIHRIPAFKSLKVLQQWQGHIDHNNFDDSPILTNHPYYLNLFIATGGPTLDLSPAVGKTIMDMMLRDNVELVDPDRLSFDRVMYNERFITE